MMIYNTSVKTGYTGETVEGRIRLLGPAARRAMDELTAVIYEPVTRKWLNRQFPEIHVASGLLLACGNGEISFMLASLLDERTTLLCIDDDAVMVQAARDTGSWHGFERIQFAHADPFLWKADQSFDFIYVRIWAAALHDQEVLWQGIRQNLKESSVLFAEIVPLSGYLSYPYNHAFSRTSEMIEQIEQPGSSLTTVPEKIRTMLEQAGFDILDMASTLPAFIPRNCNHILSLALEACREVILHCRGSPAEELNVILLELKEFEKQQVIVISRPGFLQLSARPTGYRPEGYSLTTV